MGLEGEDVEGEESEDEQEEARMVKAAKDPCSPSEDERKAHEATHLPFRNWCAECVKGRAPNPAHKRVERESDAIPEIGMDYAFVSKKDDKKQLTILVTKDRDTRVIMANVVLQKGAGLEETVTQAVENIERLGNKGRVAIKVDNEPALLDLREHVMSRIPNAAVPIKPPKGESQSNGMIEAGVKIVKGMLRVHLLALERKLEGKVPTHHPIMTWLVEHVADVITKHLQGKDGRTAYERLLGRPCREEGLEFGEKVWYRRRKDQITRTGLEARWQEGVWLGRRWGSIDHLIATENEVVDARAVQRRPIGERWDRLAIEGIEMTPTMRKIPEGCHKELVVIPPKTEREKEEEGPREVKDPPRPLPKSTYITPEDLETFGYTKGCRRCTLMREKKKAHGIRHSAACRDRIEGALAERGDARIERSRLKIEEYCELVHDDSKERGGVPEPHGSSSSSASGQQQTTPVPPAENMEVRPEEVPEEAEPNDEAQMVIGSLLRRNPEIEVPSKILPRAMSLYETLLTLGVDRDGAMGKVTEIYSPPRVTAEARRRPDLNVAAGMSFDLRADSEGRKWDFSKIEDRTRARRIIQRDKPFMVIGSPPCTDFSILTQNLNHPKMDPKEVRRRMVMARAHIEFVVQIYKDQVRGGRHFLHEHPASAASWKEEGIVQLKDKEGVWSTVSHMCQFGMQSPGDDGIPRPVLKPTRWISSAEEVIKSVSRRCTGGHEHTKLLGNNRAAKAAEYPVELCRAILRGIEAQRIREAKIPIEALQCVVDLEITEEEKKVEKLRQRRLVMAVEGGGTEVDQMRDWDGEEFWSREGEAERGGYVDDITGDKLPTKETEAARWEEIEFMGDWKVWDEVDIEECRRATGKGPIGGRWVDHNKGDSKCLNVRSRYVAQEVAKYKDESLFAATPPLEALRLMISEAATRGKVEKKMLLIDVRKAHLHATAVREVYVQLPPEIRTPGRCARLRRCLYGTRDAAARWEALYTAKLQDMGFEKGRASACCFVHRGLGAKCVVHGGDFTFLGTDKALDEIEKNMNREFLCKVEGRIGSGRSDKKEARVLGRVIKWSEDGLTYEADPRHVEILIRDLGIGEERTVVTPGTKEEKRSEEETLEDVLTDPKEIRKFRGAAARANYLAQDRPEIAFAAKECCRRMAAPRHRDIRALVRLAKYLKGQPRMVYEYPWQAEQGIDAYVDTDFAGCTTTCRSTSGGCIVRGQHLLKHWAVTQKTVTLSSGEAELAGLVKGSAEGLGLQSVAKDLGIEVELKVLGDSSAAIGICRRTGIGRVRHLAVGQLWVQERVRNGDFTLVKHPGSENPADMMTKHLDRATIEKHLKMVGIIAVAGRPLSAPHID